MLNLVQRLDELQQQAAQGNAAAAQQAGDLDAKLTRLESGQADITELKTVLTANKQHLQLQLNHMLQIAEQLYTSINSVAEGVNEIRESLAVQDLHLQDVGQHMRQMNDNLHQLAGDVKAIRGDMDRYFKHMLNARNPLPFEEAVQRLRQASEQELKEDVITAQGMSLYIPLQASNRPIQDVSQLDQQQSAQNIMQHVDSDEDENDDGKDDEKEILSNKKSNTNAAGPALYDLHKHVLQFLDDPQQQVLLLQGNAGSGKSLYGRHLEHAVWQTYHGKERTLLQTKRVPIFISLPKAYDTQQPDKNIIDSALTQKGLNKATIAMLKQRAQKGDHFVFILDSYDEIEAKINLYKKHRLYDWHNSKFIVSSRLGYVQDSDVTKLFSNCNNITTNFLAQTYIAPFSRNLIDQYIKVFQQSKFNIPWSQFNIKWDVEKYKKAMAHFSGLDEMARDPFAVNLILSTLPQLVEQHASSSKQITRTQLYDAFSQQHFDREMGKAGKTQSIDQEELHNQAEEYAEDLAFAMFVEDTQIAIAPHRRNVNAWKKFFDKKNIHLMRCNPIKGTGGDRCSFSHKSFQEYFTAQKMVNEIMRHEKSQDFNSHFVQQGASYAINQKNLNDAPAIIHLVIERMKEKGRYSMLQERLFHIIHTSKVNADVATASANAMTILNTAGIPF
ncbi:MAG: NACHT domain-containing protein, partial [Myxococcota bacterium]